MATSTRTMGSLPLEVGTLLSCALYPSREVHKPDSAKDGPKGVFQLHHKVHDPADLWESFSSPVCERSDEGEDVA